MIELHERTRRICASRIEEILLQYGCKSIVDPFMGIPTHLNYLKRHDFAVHGGDLVEWFVRAGDGLVVNDFTVLRDNEVAEIVEMLPGRIYSVDLFKAWEGVFFTEEQCIYLGVWHDNVHNLRSDGQTGLAIFGLWNVLCYWLQKAHFPDDMQDVPPSELAWHYIRKTERWVSTNLRRNTVRRSDVLTTISAQQADALFLSPPARNSFRSADARIWMWEAWWQGNPYYNIEHAYRDSLFGARSSDEQGYARAFASVLSNAQDYPVVIVQTTESRIKELEPHVRNARPKVEIYSPAPGETYLIGTK
ncbi:MAG TPA: hypothetical protein VFL13_04270 [Candidatus Baltobacteraceae bacterium]|nr:hypothetical protein [Candidatus Baltobacteraceae bacterium]